MMHRFKFLYNIFKKKPLANPAGQVFQSLAPTSNAELGEGYLGALDFSLEDESVKNIALSGPYGSGKSSVISSYSTIREKRFLVISLATFGTGPSTTNPILIDKIQKSIVQQILYGKDTNRLKHSRFSRIKSPMPFHPAAVLAALWTALILLLTGKLDGITGILALRTLPYSMTLCAITFFIISTILISALIQNTFGLRIKGISLPMGLSIDTANDNSLSVFDRNLDELIYFFTQTKGKYEAIVFEDIDRFEGVEIFVQLRSLNKLLNDNANTDTVIKFIYAVKDDLFSRNNRAKFFDFIIPVIPITTSANALEKIYQRLSKHSYKSRIKDDFIRGMALYISDLRLINNIFNEMEIYFQQLKSKELDATKLLALVTYKNIYPEDFSLLQKDKGRLSQFRDNKKNYLLKLADENLQKIERLESDIALSNKESFTNLYDLYSLYISSISRSTNNNNAIGILKSVNTGDQLILSQYTSHEQFEPFISEKNLQGYNGNGWVSVPSIEDIEYSVSNTSFAERKAAIENKDSEKRRIIQLSIDALKNKNAFLNNLKLSDVLRQYQPEDLSFKISLEDDGLFEYLILNGYIDENYHLYISNFYEGRISQIDNEYLRTVRNFNIPNPQAIIENPAEVIRDLPKEYFSQKYVLNINIVDALLSDPPKYRTELYSFSKYISTEFQEALSFLEIYEKEGKCFEELNAYLIENFPQFYKKIDSIENSVNWAITALNNTNDVKIIESINSTNTISDIINSAKGIINSNFLSALQVHSKLIDLGIKFENLKELPLTARSLEFIEANNLYEINLDNISLFLNSKNTSTDEDTIPKFSNILSKGSTSLVEYIFTNINLYVETILLKLDDQKDSREAIKKILESKNLSIENAQKILSSQEGSKFDFSELPLQYWEYIISTNQVTLNWPNLFKVISSDGIDNSIVTDWLNASNEESHLFNIKINDIIESDKDQKTVSWFIISNDDISIEKYAELVKCVGYRYDNFPKVISEAKQLVLLNEDKIALSEKSYNNVKDKPIFLASLIKNDISKFLEDSESYPASDEILERLMSSDLPAENKYFLITKFDKEVLRENKTLAAIVADVYIQMGENEADLEILEVALRSSEDLELKLNILSEYENLWDEKALLGHISSLPKNYGYMILYPRRPKIASNDSNNKFVEMLKRRNLISSFKNDGSLIRVISKKRLKPKTD